MHYDVIVIGVGSMGSAACYHLAKQGVSVLGIEQFDITHDKGSHAGQSRLFRKAYFEHPDYVPLLQRAYRGWSDIEKESGVQLLYRTGITYFGSRDGDLLKAIGKSASIYGIPLKWYDNREAAMKWPQFSLQSDHVGLFEPDAGFITPELAIKTLTKLAEKEGAEIIPNTEVSEWQVSDDLVVVKTSGKTFKSKKLVIAAGPYTKKLLAEFKPALNVTQQLLAWVNPERWDDFTLGNFPCWVMESDEGEGIYYGFPILPNDRFSPPYGLKIAYHRPCQEIDPTDVLEFDASEEEEVLRAMTEKYLPGAMREVVTFKSCLYTYSEDDHFIIDKFPGYEDQVTIACGFSGHGFKFAPVVGEALAQLSLNDATSLPVDFLNISRFN